MRARPDHDTAQQFKKRFAKLRGQGFIRSARRGPTGIGHTLEQAIGLKENNLAVPDLGEVELKAHRDGASSLITLFTFNRKAWVMKPLEAVRKYGTRDKDGRIGLYFTMTRTPNSSGLFINITDEDVWVQHTSGEIVVKWNLAALAAQFKKKVPALILVTAQTEERDGIEYFHFYRAQLLTDTSPRVLSDQLRYGNMLIDLRPHDRGANVTRGAGGRNPRQAGPAIVAALPLYRRPKQSA
ncbi:MAG: MvaI/BcnI family restriction endonuclease [Candidatus Binataceae bacterium]